jgi:hypothetical protein
VEQVFFNKPMSTRLKAIPKFRSEAKERHFWEAHDSCGLVDWSKAKRVRFPNLKPSSTSALPDAATPPVSSRAKRGI